jgi:rhodanese-related sulfurtransferase
MSEELKTIVFSELARIGKALASPIRLELLDWLCQRDFSVEELTEFVGSNIAAISHHLQILKGARLVDSRVCGTRRIYTIRPGIPAMWSTLMVVGNDNLSQIQDAMSGFLDDPDSFTAVGSAELQRRMKAGEVVVVDVRPGEEFAAGHFPGAISVPMADLETRIRDLPTGCEIIAYCRGPYCLLSHTAVRLLRVSGFQAKRWPSGPAEWLSEGVALETAKAPAIMERKSKPTKRMIDRTKRTSAS